MDKDIKRIREIREEESDNKPEHAKLITMGELLAMEFSDNEWLVEKLVPHQGITIIAGAPGNFKTWFLLLMGISITRGEKFLGNFQCMKLKVLIIDEEDHLRVLKKRALMLGADNNASLYFFSQQGFLVDNKAWVKKVLSVCEEHDIDVIFLDSLVRIHEGQENTSSDMSKVFREIKRFIQAGKTVVITHHERKESSEGSSSQAKLRGSSDISAALDSHIAMRKDRHKSHTLLVEQPKSRYDEEHDPFEVSFTKENNRMLFSYVGIRSNPKDKRERVSEALTEILEKSEGSISSKTLIEEVSEKENVGSKTVRLILDELVESKTVTVQKGNRNERLFSLPVQNGNISLPIEKAMLPT